MHLSTQNNNNNNNSETIDHDAITILSCAIEYKTIEQMVVKMFRTHCCAFDFDWKFCDAHVNEIKIEAKK
jgi:hypothetical protein